MDECAWKVQTAGTHRLRTQQASRTSQRKVIQRGDGRMFWEGSNAEHARRGAARTRDAIKKVSESASNGVMDECSGKVPEKAGTHVVSLIVMYLAVVEIHHSAAATNPKASALPNKEGTEMSGQLHPTG